MKIVYATPGAGKTSLAIMYPDKYVDGDAVIFDYLEANGLRRTTVQNAGYDLMSLPDKFAHVERLKQIFKELSLNRIVLTSNWFARDIATHAYLITDEARIARIFKERGQANAERAAKHILRVEAEAFRNKDVVLIAEGEWLNGSDT